MNKKYAYFAGGCFWGVEYYFSQFDGVIEAISGFMGGHLKNPSYKDVCYKDTGHLEVVAVAYDADAVSYERLSKLFFEIHDPTQRDGQGPDRGSQYLSAVFVSNEEERQTIQKLIDELRAKKYDVATKILEADTFYPAEDYHQHYYQKNGHMPYCHSYIQRF